MKLPCLAVLVFVLLLPIPARAQSVQLTDLVGQWHLVKSSGPYALSDAPLKILPNGVWYGRLAYNFHNPAFQFRRPDTVKISRDSVRIIYPDSMTTRVKLAVVGDSLCDQSSVREYMRCNKIVLEDHRFTLSRVIEEEGPYKGQQYSFVYERRPASTPKP